MRKYNLFQLSGLLLLTFLIVLTSPSYTQTFNAITLMSPNAEVNGGFGFPVSGAGDVNQDGFADVIVGAILEDPGTSPDDAGRAYIFSGQDGGLLFELISPNEELGGNFGNSVSGAGDVNLDGFADVIVGADRESPGPSPDFAGRAYIFSGQDGSLIFELISPNEEVNGEFGSSVSSAGDVNGDGFADVIVGARQESPGTSPDFAGRAYIFSGQDGGLLFELISPNEEALGLFGTSVSGAGDVNQDSFADVIVGASSEGPGTSPDGAGRAYIFSGQDGGLLFELISPNEEFNGNFGFSVSGAGDVNQDGFADVIVGAWLESPGTSPHGAGRAYIFNGQDGSLLFVLISPDEEFDGNFGFSVSGAGDVNQDGFADVIVGALYEDLDHDDAGSAYIFSGQAGSLLFALISPNPQVLGQFGVSVSGAGDVNQDGFADVIVGAWAELQSGRAYIFVSSGGQQPGFRINAGGPDYTDTNGNLFVADQAYATGSFGYVGGRARTFSNPIGNTEDDPLYQDLRLVFNGSFFYRFDVSSAATFEVTLYLMAPALSGPGNIVMDVLAEGEVVLDNLDVKVQAGGVYRALIKTFTVNVSDGRLDLKFVKVNKAALVCAIAVVQQSGTAPLPKGAGAKEGLVAEAPREFQLFQNYPNPFNPETEIRFALPQASHIVVKIFNLLGAEIRSLVDEQRETGYHRVRWDGKDNHGNAVSSGIYFYHLNAPSTGSGRAFSQVKKMSLVR